MISIKDYAKKYSISYEAVRSQVKRYDSELKSHIISQGRTRYLDEYAESFLDEKRNNSPVIVYDQARTEEAEALQNKVELLQEKLILCYEKMEALQNEKVQLIEERGKTKYLLEVAQEKEKELEDLKRENAELKEEATKYKKGLFGMYKKIK